MNLFYLVARPTTIKDNEHVPRSVWRFSRLRPFGAAVAVVQVADINKGRFPPDYQSVMSLLLIDYTFLEGRDDELVVKDLASYDFHTNRAFLYILKRPTTGRKYLLLTPE